MSSARYLVRIDDICSTMDWRAWEAVESLLNAHSVKPILAVVPDNRDPSLMCGDPAPDFWQRVRDWQRVGWTIAIHGYQHLYETRDSGLVGLNPFSEFAGLPIEQQRRKLTSALEIFRKERVDVEAWVAPAHSFDESTVTVLKELEITTISDGFCFRVVERLGCRWVPQQLWRFRSMPFGVWTVCLHPNALRDERNLARLEADLARYAGRIVALRDVAQVDNRVAKRTSIDAMFEAVWHLALRAKSPRRAPG